MTTTTTTTKQSKTPESPLDDIVAFTKRFVIFPDERQYDILALWTLHTWAFDAAYATPYLYVNSVEKRCGKTRVIEVANKLARNPLTGSSISPAALYRQISDVRPTLFLDEVDAIWSGKSNEDLRGVFNSGYKRNGTVIRYDQGESTTFSTFCPKLMAGIDNGELPTTIGDRSITLTLKRKKDAEEVERFIERKIEEDVEALRLKIEAWVNHNIEALMEAEPKLIDEIGDRQNEIAEPLLAIAERCKGWTKRGREALSWVLQEEEEPLSPQGTVLKATKDLMEEAQTDKLASSAIADHLGISQKQVSIYLNRYGVNSGTIRVGATTAKGYKRSDLQDSWDRYL